MPRSDALLTREQSVTPGRVRAYLPEQVLEIIRTEETRSRCPVVAEDVAVPLVAVELDVPAVVSSVPVT